VHGCFRRFRVDQLAGTHRDADAERGERGHGPAMMRIAAGPEEGDGLEDVPRAALPDDRAERSTGDGERREEARCPAIDAREALDFPLLPDAQRKRAA
jgi:hypothetical protein